MKNENQQEPLDLKGFDDIKTPSAWIEKALANQHAQKSTSRVRRVWLPAAAVILIGALTLGVMLSQKEPNDPVGSESDFSNADLSENTTISESSNEEESRSQGEVSIPSDEQKPDIRSPLSDTDPIGVVSGGFYTRLDAIETIKNAFSVYEFPAGAEVGAVYRMREIDCEQRMDEIADCLNSNIKDRLDDSEKGLSTATLTSGVKVELDKYGHLTLTVPNGKKIKQPASQAEFLSLAKSGVEPYLAALGMTLPEYGLLTNADGTTVYLTQKIGPNAADTLKAAVTLYADTGRIRRIELLSAEIELIDYYPVITNDEIPVLLEKGVYTSANALEEKYEVTEYFDIYLDLPGETFVLPYKAVVVKQEASEGGVTKYGVFYINAIQKKYLDYIE